VVLLLTVNSGTAFYANAQMTPHQAIEKMTCGINVGRSLEILVLIGCVKKHADNSTGCTTLMMFFKTHFAK
jgi:hypothetical protein